MFDEQVIHGETLYPCSDDSGTVRFGARLPWYRSLPLSCVERLEVAVDGRPVDPDKIRLSLYGSTHEAAELPALHEISWFVNDVAAISFRPETPLASGDHELNFFIRLRIPYTDEPFPQVVSEKKILHLVEADY